MKKLILIMVIAAIAGLMLQSCKKWSEQSAGNLMYVTNEGGSRLAYDTTTGVKLLFHKGFAFKDLNKNGSLDKYEDWRLSADERARDLADKMSIEEIAGLMLYSAHQSVPAGRTRFMGGTYNGKPFDESGAKASDLSDQQIKFLTGDQCPPCAGDPCPKSRNCCPME